MIKIVKQSQSGPENLAPTAFVGASNIGPEFSWESMKVATEEPVLRMEGPVVELPNVHHNLESLVGFEENKIKGEP
jgi:hypothetical protein